MTNHSDQIKKKKLKSVSDRRNLQFAS